MSKQANTLLLARLIAPFSQGYFSLYTWQTRSSHILGSIDVHPPRFAAVVNTLAPSAALWSRVEGDACGVVRWGM
jgi:hypothetical protein